MTPEIRKAFNTYMGVLLIIIAIFCFGLTAYMVLVPEGEKDAVVEFAPVPKQPCLDGLRKLGLSVTEVGPDIKVQDSSNDAPEERLLKASLGISMCHFYLKDFCIGNACPVQGLSFTITPYDPENPKARKNPVAGVIQPSSAAPAQIKPASPSESPGATKGLAS